MTKQQTKQLSNIRFYAMHQELRGAAARGLSAMIRCAMTKKSQVELLEEAQRLGLTSYQDFIINN